MKNIPEIPREYGDKYSDKSYSAIIGDIGESAKDLVLNDMWLLLAELKQIKHQVAKESRKFFIFTCTLALSAFPILAFLVLGLGKALDGNYMLSSLIIGVVFAIGGAIGITMVINRIKKVDFNFTKTKAAFKREGEAFSTQIHKIQDTMKGERHAH